MKQSDLKTYIQFEIKKILNENDNFDWQDWLYKYNDAIVNYINAYSNSSKGNKFVNNIISNFYAILSHELEDEIDYINSEKEWEVFREKIKNIVNDRTADDYWQEYKSEYLETDMADLKDAQRRLKRLYREMENVEHGPAGETELDDEIGQTESTIENLKASLSYDNNKGQIEKMLAVAKKIFFREFEDLETL